MKWNMGFKLIPHIRQNTDLLVKWYYQTQGGHFYDQKDEFKFTDFECNLLINGMNMFDTIIEQMKETECVTGQLKKKNQFEWVRQIQNIESRSREFIIRELIFV